jgi:hypothetical protein
MKQTIFLFFIILLAGCSKDEATNPVDLLPPATQTGANTFGCLIDGKVFLPRSGNNSLVFPLSGAILWGGIPQSYDYNEIEIVDYKSAKSASLLFHMENIFNDGSGSYVINQSNGMNNIDGLDHHYLHCIIYDKLTNSYQKYVSFTNSGTFTITRLLTNSTNGNNGNLLSGTFNCRVRNINNPNDEIEITQGRFDINSLTIASTYFP